MKNDNGTGDFLRFHCCICHEYEVEYMWGNII